MNQSVKTGLGLALGTALVGAAVTAGYFYCTGQLPFVSRGPSKPVEKKKKRVKKSTSVSVESIAEDVKSASAPAVTEVSPPAPANKKPPRFIDLPLEQIMALTPEKKEQVFYGLLMEGESILGQGKEGEAVDMFVKALTMVPSPTDILLAFEKSLPAGIFAKILTRLQDSVRQRQATYFGKISGEYFDFALRPETNEATGSKVDHWAMRAKQDIPEDTVLVVERPDVIFPTMHGLSKNVVTEDAFGPSDKSPLSAATDMSAFVEQLEAKGKEAYNKLLEHCKKNQTSVPLLLLRYIAILMKLELKAFQTGSSVNAGIGNDESFFFSHYDNLRPALRSPTDLEKREAGLLRTIFDNKATSGTANIKEFLSNEIYTAMKFTLQFNSLGLPASANNSSDHHLSCKEYLRWGGYSIGCQALGIYHTIAHLDHSNEPNVSLSADPNLIISIRTSKPVKEGEWLSMSYLAPDDLRAREKRSILLATHFGIFNTTTTLSSS